MDAIETVRTDAGDAAGIVARIYYQHDAAYLEPGVDYETLGERIDDPPQMPDADDPDAAQREALDTPYAVWMHSCSQGVTECSPEVANRAWILRPERVAQRFEGHPTPSAEQVRQWIDAEADEWRKWADGCQTRIIIISLL